MLMYIGVVIFSFDFVGCSNFFVGFSIYFVGCSIFFKLYVIVILVFDSLKVYVVFYMKVCICSFIVFWVVLV